MLASFPLSPLRATANSPSRTLRIRSPSEAPMASIRTFAPPKAPPPAHPLIINTPSARNAPIAAEHANSINKLPPRLHGLPFDETRPIAEDFAHFGPRFEVPGGALWSGGHQRD